MLSLVVRYSDSLINETVLINLKYNTVLAKDSREYLVSVFHAVFCRQRNSKLWINVIALPGDTVQLPPLQELHKVRA